VWVRISDGPALETSLNVLVKTNVRERLQSVSDEELIRYGRASRKQRNLRDVFKMQWEEARAEWRRRHPKA
jgi:hypothetical protein